MPTRVLNGTTNGISRKIVIERTCLVDNGGPLLSEFENIIKHGIFLRLKKLKNRSTTQYRDISSLLESLSMCKKKDVTNRNLLV